MAITGGGTAIDKDEQPDVHSSSEHYAGRFSGRIGAHLLAVQSRAIREMLDDIAPGTALDVGGGHGQTAGLLSDLGFSVTVLGSREDAFERLRNLKIPCETLVGDLAHLPLADRSHDVVLSVRMMAHVPDWRQFVGELCRVARHAVIIDFARDGGSNALKPLLFGIKKRFEGNTRPFATMTDAEIRSRFDQAGFAVDRAIGQFVMPMAVHRALASPGISTALERSCARFGLDRKLGTPVIMRALRQTSNNGA